MSFSLLLSYHCRRLPASAADLKFLHCPLRVRNGNFKSAALVEFQTGFQTPRSLETICALT